MKISCIQMDMLLGSPNENFEKAKELIEKAVRENSPDTVVLPETWNTGFFPKENIEELCDDNGKRVKEEIGGLAKKHHINIVAGSVSNIKNGKVYNTAYVFDRNGQVVCEYDKTHLFTPMGEHEYYEKGDRLGKFELDGTKCGILICYDIRFPELTRSITVNGADYLFVVSQWPTARVYHLETLVKARAIENQIFAVCCNSCGTAGQTKYAGHSLITDPWGNVLSSAEETETIISAECDESTLSEIRNSINVFADRREEMYNINKQ